MPFVRASLYRGSINGEPLNKTESDKRLQAFAEFDVDTASLD